MILPGQYRGADEQKRAYGEVEVSLYASTSNDWQGPIITNTTHAVNGASVTITVTTMDDPALTDGACHGVHRVIVTYTDGRGLWESLDLVPSGQDTWQGMLQLTGEVEYFVQVVDEAGNVTVDDNGASYYTSKYTNHSIYLPIVLRNE